MLLLAGDWWRFVKMRRNITISISRSRSRSRSWLQNICFILLILGLLSSCTQWRKKDDDAELAQKIQKAVAPPPPPPKEYVKFSENPNVGTFSDRKYRRATRKSLEDESEVHSHAGSLWNNEGQSAYLFTQNKARKEGDLLNVKLEGSAKSQVETKVQVIKKLLARIEMTPVVVPQDPQNGSNQDPRGLASMDPAKKDNLTKDAANNSSTGGKNNNNSASQAAVNAAMAARATPPPPAPEPIEDTPFNVDMVSTRVVERLADGNYRVKGTQPFMIGKREYKVIVTGFVRPEDFSDENMSSNKMIDPQWDVVSLRRVQQ